MILRLLNDQKRQFWEYLLQIKYRKTIQSLPFKRTNLAPHTCYVKRFKTKFFILNLNVLIDFIPIKMIVYVEVSSRGLVLADLIINNQKWKCMSYVLELVKVHSLHLGPKIFSMELNFLLA